MGNTPSAQHGSPAPAHSRDPAAPPSAGPASERASTENPTAGSSTAASAAPSSAPDPAPSTTADDGGGGVGGTGGGGGAPPGTRNPNLRLPMPSRPHISPNSSNPASPSGRSISPRRRKSLELPDLNKLSFTPAAPVATTATSPHHATLPSSSKRTSLPAEAPKRWQQVLGGRTASPLAGANALSAMSKLDPSIPAPRTAPISMPNSSVSPARAADAGINPYFPETSPKREASPRRAEPIPIPDRAERERAGERVGRSQERSGAAGIVRDPTTGATPPPPSIAATPPIRAEVLAPGIQPVEPTPDDGLVNVPIAWNGGGRSVYVTGNFADNWKGRIKLRKSTHDFNTTLRLAPGHYRLKFIVDDSWRCAKQIPTATDDDGTLVNWIEVEAPKTEEELKAEWAMDAKPAAKHEDKDEAQWITTIPAPLVLYQYIEELPSTMEIPEFDNWARNVPYISNVPQPPTLPRILDRVIVNEQHKGKDSSSGFQAPPGGNDDNSILSVPNHVVLNHLTASAIKNGTLGVGTTTRYRKKYITTMFFKPTLQDQATDQPPTSIPAQ